MLQFWASTPHEFRLALEAFQETEDHVMHKIAWHAANTMNMHTKKGKTITVAKLLGKQAENITSEADFRRIQDEKDERRTDRELG